MSKKGMVIGPEPDQVWPSIATKPMPAAMTKMLWKLQAGRPWYDGLNGRAEHGGGTRTLYALKKRGYIDSVGDCKVTELGQAALTNEANAKSFI